MEGTENLDDEIFLKRHLKSEIDERRRKRWDMQQLREQRRTERLRRRLLPDAGRGRSSSCLQSFCSHPRNVHFVEVVEALPVVAFGQPIPSLEPSEFAVPWFDLAERQQRRAKCRRRSSHSSSNKW